MDEIDQRKIGKRFEIAHEIMNHPIISKTNLPPMRVKNIKSGKLLKGCSFPKCKGPIKGMPYTCKRCGKKFCSEHRLPDNHNCPFLERG